MYLVESIVSMERTTLSGNGALIGNIASGGGIDVTSSTMNVFECQLLDNWANVNTQSACNLLLLFCCRLYRTLYMHYYHAPKYYCQYLTSM